MKLFSLLRKGDVHAEGDAKIIRKETFSELLSSKELIEKTKEDIEQYKEENRIECEKLREEEKVAGFNEGLANLNAHIVHLDLLIKQLRHDITQQILPIALKAAKKIVGTELKTAPETIVDIVVQSLQPALQSHRVNILINKKDREHLEAQKGRLREILEQLEVLKIIERDDITPGGCIIETESGVINAELENQWRSLEAAFEKYMRAQEGS